VRLVLQALATRLPEDHPKNIPGIVSTPYGEVPLLVKQTKKNKTITSDPEGFHDYYHKAFQPKLRNEDEAYPYYGFDPIKRRKALTENTPVPRGWMTTEDLGYSGEYHTESGATFAFGYQNYARHKLAQLIAQGKDVDDAVKELNDKSVSYRNANGKILLAASPKAIAEMGEMGLLLSKANIELAPVEWSTPGELDKSKQYRNTYLEFPALAKQFAIIKEYELVDEGRTPEEARKIVNDDYVKVGCWSRKSSSLATALSPEAIEEMEQRGMLTLREPEKGTTNGYKWRNGASSAQKATSGARNR